VDIAEFLTACLDEDERGALAAAEEFGPDWSEIWSGTLDLTDNRPDRQPNDEKMLWETHVNIGDSRITRFMANHDPARVLADIAAKRKLLALWQKIELGVWSPDANQFADDLLEQLLAPYGKRAAWNPADGWRLEDLPHATVEA
jgi:hypothetical protein